VAEESDERASGEGAERAGGEGAERAGSRPALARPGTWRTVARPLVAAAYAALLASASWSGGMSDDGGSTPLLLGVLTVLAWGAITVLTGYLLPRSVFVVIALAVAIPAFVGERGEQFDEELRYFNWMLIAALNALVAIPGVWLAHRRWAGAR
jgi:hypothetical protein